MKIKKIIILGLTVALIGECTPKTTENPFSNPNNIEVQQVEENSNLRGFSYDVDPETFQVTITKDGKEIPVSAPFSPKKITEYQENQGEISWNYPDEEISVKISPKGEYVSVVITYYGVGEAGFRWPHVKADTYALPLGEGKWIPSDDPTWTEYLGGEIQDTIESFTMNFFAAGHENNSIVYVMDNSFDNQVIYGKDSQLDVTVSHEYTSINENKTYGFRIYPANNDPVSISKIYRNDLIERGQFVALEEKAVENPNVEKLYGAIHMYMFDMRVVSESDINWTPFREQLSSSYFGELEQFIQENLEEQEDFFTIIAEVKNQDFVSEYQKGVICRTLSSALLLPEFQTETSFENEVQMIEANKKALDDSMPGAFQPIETWGDDRTTDILSDMYESGLTKAWIGIDNWEQGYVKPELIDLAVEKGYLIGPYDSYHSIHEKGKEEWHTATLDDGDIFETDTIADISGKKIEGFQGVGRKLNPTLTLPLVKTRVSKISNTLSFNSWFIDCDATGEVFNDYTLGHETTKEMDIAARLERMNWIKTDAGMVVGSEGGNDYAAPYIAFAHGIELQAFSWMDDDMKNNKESEYYMGRYYAPNGGAPEKMTKTVPVKEKYKNIFLNPAYNIPLFKLVYNDSVITTYHWDWSTLKIMDEVENRMMYEFLYNVPPLYHIDKFQWEENKEIILSHAKEWGNFSTGVINKEMTNFQILSDDRLVQITDFSGTKVIANFSDVDFTSDDYSVPANDFIVLN